jgi:hypothetical protein
MIENLQPILEKSEILDTQLQLLDHIGYLQLQDTKSSAWLENSMIGAYALGSGFYAMLQAYARRMLPTFMLH